MNATHDSVTTVYKQVGETPLQAVERCRAKRGIARHVPMAYAGRLDPMAEGVLLILIGEACKRQRQYQGMDKAYEVEILLGWESDTHDVLGLAQRGVRLTVHPDEAKRALRAFTGEIALPYPVFSSKTVRGTPLFEWALRGQLDEIDIPIRRSHIYKFRYSSITDIPLNVLRERIFSKINTLPPVTEPSKALGADFRRTEIRKQWEALFTQERTASTAQVLAVRCYCSSGTYMRTLAHFIGTELGTSGLALSIRRTKIGRYRTLGPWGFWIKQY